MELKDEDLYFLPSEEKLHEAIEEPLIDMTKISGLIPEPMVEKKTPTYAISNGQRGRII